MTPVRRLSALVVLPALLLLAIPPAARAAQTETERVDRTIPFQDGGSLRLKTFSGHVTITAAEQPQVVIHALRRATRDRLDRIKLDIQQSGSTITIDANKKVSSGWFEHDNVVETDFEIQVPTHTELNIETFSSPVEISGIAAEERVKGFSSPITLTEVTGPVTAHTFSGDIEVRSTRWTAGESLDAQTFSGDIALRLPATTHADVEFKTFSGDLHSDIPLLFQEQRHGTVRAQFRSAGNDAGSLSDFHLHTFSGDVRIQQ